MTIVKTNTFEGVEVGVRVSTSNQNADGTSGDALTIVRGTTGEILGANTSPIVGTKYVKITGAAAADATFGMIDITPVSAATARIAVRLDASAPNNSCLLLARTSAGTFAQVLVSGTSFALWDSNSKLGGADISAPGDYTVGDIVVLDFSADPATGKCKLMAYDLDGNDALGLTAPVEFTGLTENLGGGQVTSFRTGWIQYGGICPGLSIDNLDIDNTYTGLGALPLPDLATFVMTTTSATDSGAPASYSVDATASVGTTSLAQDAGDTDTIGTISEAVTGVFTFNDPGGTDPLHLTLTAGADDLAFTINRGGGEVTYARAFLTRQSDGSFT